MRETHIRQAEENGHEMVRVNPNRYECQKCPASIEKIDCRYRWQASKTGNYCPGQVQTESQESDDSKEPGLEISL